MCQAHLKCPNCKGPHAYDDLSCPARPTKKDGQIIKPTRAHLLSIRQLGEHQEKLKKELKQLEEEGKKKITSDDIHEGFESHVSMQLSPYCNAPLILPPVCTPKASATADQGRTHRQAQAGSEGSHY